MVELCCVYLFVLKSYCDYFTALLCILQMRMLYLDYSLFQVDR